MPPQEPPPQQGPGTHTFADGTYTGEFHDGKRHGQGKMTYTAGARSVWHATLRTAGGTRARVREAEETRVDAAWTRAAVGMLRASSDEVRGCDGCGRRVELIV